MSYKHNGMTSIKLESSSEHKMNLKLLSEKECYMTQLWNL